ncbi:MAG: hypothetical protein IIB35_03595, partial [Gemmatimonadetes bacterium]|nr:hypothetical protein [Gemmatimonadota bacterium]
MNSTTTVSDKKGAWERFRQSRYAYHGARWLPLACLALLTYAFFPVAAGLTVFVPEVGDVSTEEVVAPFEFYVLKTEAERQQEGDELAAQVVPIYEYRSGISDSIAAHVDRIFASLDSADTATTILDIARRLDMPLTQQEAVYFEDAEVRSVFRRSIVRMINIHLARGVAARRTIETETQSEVFLRRGGDEVRMHRDSITTQAQYLALRASENPDPNSAAADFLFVNLLNKFFRPTIVSNLPDTESRRERARASVDPVKDHVRANERIINNHEIVTAEAK